MTPFINQKLTLQLSSPIPTRDGPLRGVGSMTSLWRARRATARTTRKLVNALSDELVMSSLTLVSIFGTATEWCLEPPPVAVSVEDRYEPGSTFDLLARNFRNDTRNECKDVNGPWQHLSTRRPGGIGRRPGDHCGHIKAGNCEPQDFHIESNLAMNHAMTSQHMSPKRSLLDAGPGSG